MLTPTPSGIVVFDLTENAVFVPRFTIANFLRNIEGINMNLTIRQK